jgi:glycosyltransferase involved in cell wall biosynthesis
MSEPLVSIIIPVYNAEKYLAETIKSALGQTWPNKEIIIVDDESTDNSLAVARSFKSNLITIISQKNSGASVARNSGLNIARGKYIQFLDADDIISADKIASQLTILNNLDTHLTVCSTIHFKTGDDYNNLPITHEWFEEGSDDPVDFLLKLYAGKEVMPGYGGMIQPNAWLTPKKLIDKAGPWNEFRCPDDDGEFFCRVILAGQGVKFSSNGINYYRKHDTGNSLSAQKSREAMQNKLLAIDLKYSHLKNRPNTEQLGIWCCRLSSI